jgi:hypothetical protein
VELLCKIKLMTIPIIVAEMGFCKNVLFLIVFPNPFPPMSLNASERRPRVQINAKMIRNKITNLRKIERTCSTFSSDDISAKQTIRA